METKLRSHLFILGLAGRARCRGVFRNRGRIDRGGRNGEDGARADRGRVVRDLSETLSLTGTLDPRAEVTVVPEISARLDRVLKNEGDRVTRGSSWPCSTTADFRLSRDRAQAHLDVAEANRAHASAEKDRADAVC